MGPRVIENKIGQQSGALEDLLEYKSQVKSDIPHWIMLCSGNIACFADFWNSFKPNVSKSSGKRKI